MGCHQAPRPGRHHAVDAGESEGALRIVQVTRGIKVGRIEFQVPEGAYGSVARGGDVLDRDGRTGGPPLPLRRPHIERKTKAEVTKAVREMERARDDKKLRKAGKGWTVQSWLEHWVENIAKPYVSENTYDGYEVDVRVHLVAGLGAHKLDRLEPEHLERFYRKMQASGSSAGTAHHAHRTIRVALGEAVRRGHVATNAAEIAEAPRLEEEDIEPYTIEEVQSLLVEAAKLRNSARWVVALALGLRQREALGLHWEDVDLTSGYVRIRKNRPRPKYAHGCGANPCGRKAGYCPKREQTRREHKSTESRAGRRTIGLPDPLIKILRQHQEAQEQERIAAGADWAGKGYVFASPIGGPLSPNTDFHVWKRLLRDAGVRNGRLHDVATLPRPSC